MWRRGSSINNAQEAGSLLKGNGEAVDLGERRGWGGDWEEKREEGEL